MSCDFCERTDWILTCDDCGAKCCLDHRSTPDDLPIQCVRPTENGEPQGGAPRDA